MNKTYNFRLREDEVDKSKPCAEGEFRDLRNGITCVNPTCDLECYFNYLELLNGCIDDWKSFGYLDLGMMPVSMGPSFMQKNLNEVVIRALSNYGIELFQMIPTSQLYSACKLPSSDIWVFREDAAGLMHVSPDKVQAVDFLKWVFKL